MADRDTKIMVHGSDRVMAVNFLPFFVVFAAADNPVNWARQLAGFISLARRTHFEDFLRRMNHVRRDGDLYVLPNGNAVRQAVEQSRNSGAWIYDLRRV